MITQALIISLIILFLHYTTWEDEIFEGIKKIIKPEGKLYKPIYGCPVCMTPWWGSALYWIIYGYGVENWIITIGAAAGISVLFVVALTFREACVNYNKQQKGKFIIINKQLLDDVSK